jgi:hypothetical protein
MLLAAGQDARPVLIMPDQPSTGNRAAVAGAEDRVKVRAAAPPGTILHIFGS